MVAKAFVVAMAADIARSDYAKPTLIRSRSREWLIAYRWGRTMSIFLIDDGGHSGARLTGWRLNHTRRSHEKHSSIQHDALACHRRGFI